MLKERFVGSRFLGLAVAVCSGILAVDLSATNSAGLVGNEEPVPRSHSVVPIEVLQPYFTIQRTLAADSFDGVPEQAEKLAGAGIPGAQRLARSAGIKEARGHFKTVSDHLIEQVRVGGVEGQPAHLAHCPMAFHNKGASWLQEEKRVANPYYGSTMLRCGRIVEALGGSSEGLAPAGGW